MNEILYTNTDTVKYAVIKTPHISLPFDLSDYLVHFDL